MQITNRINYTKRRKLHRSEVEIVLHEIDGEAPSFDVRFSLSTAKLPDDAAVYVEAYRGNTLQRFDFGTVAAIRPPADRYLRQIDLTGRTLFRVRIVDKSAHLGRLIASAEKLTAEGDSDDDQKTSLIVVQSRPLGRQTWKIDFVEDGKPLLCINNRIPDAIGQLKHNPVFQALVFPAALRQVLMFILWNDDEEEGSIQKLWLDFAEFIGGDRPHVSDPVTLVSWIDDVVEKFSERFELCDMLLSRMEESA